MHLSQQNYMKIADSVWLTLYMRDNEQVQHPSRPLALAWYVLKLQTINVLESMIRIKSNLYIVKYSIFYMAHFLNLLEALMMCCLRYDNFQTALFILIIRSIRSIRSWKIWFWLYTDMLLFLLSQAVYCRKVYLALNMLITLFINGTLMFYITFNR
jgi:hypothetical protein